MLVEPVSTTEKKKVKPCLYIIGREDSPIIDTQGEQFILVASDEKEANAKLALKFNPTVEIVIKGRELMANVHKKFKFTEKEA